ncbi:hypothetical protein TNIN_389491 [Trichonephila inaurata madagascariensis]|uniref:Uncharacterized protein n=1 Tax=Trichonephila inaurata madagascariensis TaxID=2747483 RepID=A0A8X6WQ65_9ARAC|nr:hypothetical protein TNIN_389491 [Trichonephila inaurata madagascariensis]
MAARDNIILLEEFVSYKKVIFFALVAALCCESTYIGGSYGPGGGYAYNVPGFGYGGLRPYPYGVPGLPSGVYGGGLAYNDFYGSNYGIDGPYGAGFFNKGVFAPSPFKYGFGSNLGLFGGNYGYVVKK